MGEKPREKIAPELKKHFEAHLSEKRDAMKKDLADAMELQEHEVPQVVHLFHENEAGRASNEELFRALRKNDLEEEEVLILGGYCDGIRAVEDVLEDLKREDVDMGKLRNVLTRYGTYKKLTELDFVDTLGHN